jgi:hypothetical protein
MNHQKQLTAFFQLTLHNPHLFPSHISLYTVLFQLWSRNRFQNPVGIIREDVIQLSKINSKATYHKCMRDLQDLNFITYHPSFSQYHSSTVQMNTLKWEPVQLLPTSSINEQLSKSTGSINELDKKDIYIIIILIITCWVQLNYLRFNIIYWSVKYKFIDVLNQC